MDLFLLNKYCVIIHMCDYLHVIIYKQTMETCFC